MAIDGIKVVGGRMEQKHLNTSLGEMHYEIGKAFVWLGMLKDKMVPTKWFKATKKGTKINFSYPQTQKEWDDSYAELKNYLVAINEKYGTDYYIGGPEE